ncbi:MAG: DUF342 domain-containing protein [Campylobacterales bacterium]|nr:DUF342 domain-containing protein [Campylobacterales bacterium]
MISFKPLKSRTVSIPKTLSEFSKAKNISIKNIDFELGEFKTFVRRKDVSEDLCLDPRLPIAKDILFDQNARIYQKYELTIFPSELDTTPYNISLSYNQNKTKVIATIKAGTIFSVDKELKEKLQSYIWKKKLLSGFLIGVFEAEFQKQLQKLVEILPYGKKLSKDIRFSVAVGFDPIPSKDSQIETIYLNKKEEHNYIDGIHEDELVLRYIKPKQGQGGRNCEGKYIPSKAPLILSVPKTDETIRIEESEECIEFYAADKGYVHYKDDFLCISKTLNLEGAHFKTTGHLDAKELNKEVSVAIAHTRGHHEDGIGKGLRVDVKDLNTDGSVGANVRINAASVNIDAQTHKKSTLEVKNKASIKLHRGELISNEAEIDILETGKIVAHKTIHIKKMIGGEAIAPKIYIQELGSNAKITASELIEIKSISGSNNTLMINPGNIDAYHKEKETLQQEIEKLKNSYEKDSKVLQDMVTLHHSELDRIKTFQKRIKQAQAAGKAPTKQDLIRVREYKRQSQTMQDQKLELSQRTEKIKELETKLGKMLAQDLHAHIRTDSLYDGHTKVIFVNPKDGQEIVFLPEGKIAEISLELDENGQRGIKTLL